MNKSLLTVIGIAAAAILAGAAIYFSSPHGSDTFSNRGEYQDPNSGQTISDPAGKAPDTYGVDPNKPIYLGITSLLNYGVTQSQLDVLKSEFYKYSQTKKPLIKEVSIKTSSIAAVPHDSESAVMGDVITFDVVFDRKTTVHARFNYQNLDTGRLVLSNSSGQIFDSGDMVADPSD